MKQAALFTGPLPLLALAAGCGDDSPGKDAAIEAGSEVAPADGGVDACVPPANTICSEPLTLSTCAKVWEGSTAPACTIDERTGQDLYTGPYQSHLIRAHLNAFASQVCFYDPVSKALVSEFFGGDLILDCCASTWRGPHVPGFNPQVVLCTRSDGGVSLADARTD